MLNKSEKILLYGSNLWLFADGMFGPLFAVFTEKIHGNILDISWAWTIYLIVTGVLSIIIGKISDKVGQKQLMVTGYALTAIFTFSFLLVSQPMHLFIVQVGLGVALALCNSTWYALYSKNSDDNEAGYTWGLNDGQGKICTAFAILIGGTIVSYSSFQTLFIIMGVIQTIATIYIAQILNQP